MKLLLVVASRMSTRTSKAPWQRYPTKQKDGKRSGLETQVASQLDAAKVEYQYEPDWIKYEKPSRSAKYLPDFKLKNGIIIETKGRFVTADRQKHLQIKACHPDLDIRFVFSNPQARISKISKTTYAMWCEKNGFKYAKLTVPKEWFQ